MRIATLILALTSLTLLTNAQVHKVWFETWGGSDNYGIGRGMGVDSAGHVYVAGSTTINGSFMGVVVKYGALGEHLWETVFGTSPTQMVVDKPGNVYLTGVYYSGSFAELVAKKINPDGGTDWTHTFSLAGGAGGSDIAVDRAGNVYVSGWGKIDTPTVRYKIVVVKYSASGDKLWDVNDTVGTYIQNVPLAVDDRGVYVCAPVRGVTYLIGYGLDGSRRWFIRHGTYAGYSPGYQGDIALDKEGNIYFTSCNSRGGNPSLADLLVGSYTGNGGLRWTHTWACSPGGMASGSAIAVDDSTGSILVAGLYYPDFWINVKRAVALKFTSQGGWPWTQTFVGERSWDCFNSIAADHHGNAYVAGFTDRLDSGSVCLLIKYGPAGEVIWSTRDSVRPGDDTWIQVVVDSAENVFVGGNVTTAWDPYTIVLATTRYVQRFKPELHGWQFANEEEYMWPQAWWSQFDYSLPIYPAILTEWPIYADTSDFPDWPLFVEAFGEDQCSYPSSSPGSPIWKISAIMSWRSIVSKWGGSCFGLCTSSLLIYNDFLSFEEMFPSDRTVFSVPLSATTRRLSNKYHQYQTASDLLELYRPLYAKTAKETARELIAMISDSGRTNKSLSILNNAGSGGHEVVPCKVTGHPGTQNIIDVAIYDPNYPGKEAILSIDTVGNFWWYDSLPGWGGPKKLFLGLDISTYATKHSLPKAGAGRAQSRPMLAPDSTGIILYVKKGSGCMIIDSNGDSLGFDPSDSSLTTDMAGAFPIILRTGGYSPPIGYYLQAGRYDVAVSSAEDTSLYLRTIGHDAIVAYEEHGARRGEKARFMISRTGDSLLVRNPETRGRRGMLRTIRVSPEREMVCDIADMTLRGNDSLAISVPEGNRVQLHAGDSASTYTLSLTLAAPDTSLHFRHRGVTLPRRSVHTIAPNWERLDSVPVNVFVDLDGDGIPDDTLTLANEPTDVSSPRGAIDVPSDYRLEQNFPNPFNPVTTIRYGLPQKSSVELTVYNLLGQKVATLVNEEKQAGHHEERFDGSALASGMYIYRLNTHPVNPAGGGRGSFVQSRKLLLLR